MPCSISPPEPQGAQGKSKTEPKVPPKAGTRGERGSSRVRVTCIAGISLWPWPEEKQGVEMLGWGWWRSLVGPWPLLLNLEKGEHKSRDG